MADKKTETADPKTHTIEVPVRAFLPAGFQPVKATATAEKVTFEAADGGKEMVDVAAFELPDGVQVTGGKFRRGRAARLLLSVTGASANMGANVTVDSFGEITIAYH